MFRTLLLFVAYKQHNLNITLPPLLECIWKSSQIFQGLYRTYVKLHRLPNHLIPNDENMELDGTRNVNVESMTLLVIDVL